MELQQIKEDVGIMGCKDSQSEDKIITETFHNN